jgi:Xaa-Pro aminopeptidase
MARLEVPSALVLQRQNIGYLSGFRGSTAAILITPNEALFITDSRYAVEARAETSGLEVTILPTGARYEEGIADQAKRLGVDVLAVESDHVTLDQFDVLRELLPGVVFRPVRDLLGPLREVKDADELDRMRAACRLADGAFEYILPRIRPGVRERELALDLEFWMRREGADREAFDTIVASGARSALPHGRASGKPIEAGDFVTMDFGAQLDAYHSDLTRTVVVGPATARQREVYGVVLEAQLAALAAIRVGAAGKAVDAVARELITARGYGDHFGHGLGHGLGRSVHEGTRVLSTRSEVTLQRGMVVTVEPGIYIEGWGGVRIEDNVVVTDTGCELLTHSPKQLIELSLS